MTSATSQTPPASPAGEIPLPFQELLRPHLPYSGAGALAADADLAGRGLDSMAGVQLLSDVEAEFGVELPDEILDEATFATAGSLWAAVSALVGSGADAV